MAAILPTGHVWVGRGGGDVVKNMLFLSKVQGFDSLSTPLITNVSLQYGSNSPLKTVSINM